MGFNDLTLWRNLQMMSPKMTAIWTEQFCENVAISSIHVRSSLLQFKYNEVRSVQRGKSLQGREVCEVVSSQSKAEIASKMNPLR